MYTLMLFIIIIKGAGPRRGRTPPPRKDVQEIKPAENELLAKLKKRRNKGTAWYVEKDTCTCRREEDRVYM